jgi:predicted ATP-grasp superfamily ATP-dependent carboligase
MASVLMVDGNDNVGLFTARCLGQMPGLRLHVLSDRNSSPLRWSRHTVSFRAQDMDTDTQRFDAIQQAVEQHRPDILLATREAAIRFFAGHRDSLIGLAALAPTPPPAMFDTAVDKWKLANLLSGCDIPGPPTLLHTANGAFEDQLSAFEFPVLIKPRLGSFGQGIQRFETAPALLDHLRTVPDQNFLVQSLIPGYDIDCSVLCRDGKILAYTIQRGFLARPHPFAAPAGIDFLYEEQIYETVQRMMLALRWTGIAHIDLRHDERDGVAKVVEINPRYWASIIGSLLAGVNFPHLAIRLGLGEDISRPNYRPARFIAWDVGLIQKVRRHPNARFAWKDTDLKFALADPLAELVKLRNQIGQKVR